MFNFFFVLVILTTFVVPAYSHDPKHPGPYDEWMESVMKPDAVGSCCGVADQYWARSYMVSTKKDIAFEVEVVGKDSGSDFTIDVPIQKVVWDRVNPTGRGVIWIGLSEWGFAPQVICFIPGSGV